MKRAELTALSAGVLFALGLGLGGMTDPARVIGFLDLAGAWDPRLAFVMASAIAVHLVFVAKASKLAAPRFAQKFVVPIAVAIDRRLVMGSALFGVGWGIAGYCPGPAVVSLVTLSPKAIAFVLAMLAGMHAATVILQRLAVRDQAPSSDAIASRG
jgi:uncharacterized protein